MKLSHWLKFGLDLIFPRRCAGCKRGGTYLCETCVWRAEAASDIPLPHTYALFAYRAPAIRRAIWLLKYKGIREIAAIFGAILHERFVEELAEIETFNQKNDRRFLLVPIPQSRRSYHARGFNPAGEIARHLAAKDPTYFQFAPDALKKVRKTPTQVSLKDRAARLANLRQAFSVNLDYTKCPVKERNVILIDDVITTGATIAEARRVLKMAGAGVVVALAVAHG